MTTLNMRRGDRIILTVSGLVDANGAPTVFDVNDKLRWTAKLHYGDVDADALIEKTSPSGGITFVPGTGEATITILPADWVDILFPLDQRYVWDLQLAVGGDATNVVTLKSGNGTIFVDVSRTVP